MGHWAGLFLLVRPILLPDVLQLLRLLWWWLLRRLLETKRSRHPGRLRHEHALSEGIGTSRLWHQVSCRLSLQESAERLLSLMLTERVYSSSLRKHEPCGLSLHRLLYLRHRERLASNHLLLLERIERSLWLEVP